MCVAGNCDASVFKAGFCKHHYWYALGHGLVHNSDIGWPQDALPLGVEADRFWKRATRPLSAFIAPALPHDNDQQVSAA